MKKRMILLLLFASLPCMAAMNLEVPIEMLANGAKSSNSSIINRTWMQVKLDSDYYDGATYYFEIVAENDDGTDRNVTLYDVTNAGNVTNGAITVASTDTEPTRFRTATAWVPASAANITYSIVLDQTTTTDLLKVYCARIIIIQANATKTRIQIPLVYAVCSDAINTAASDVAITTTLAYTLNPTPCALYLKDSDNLATVSGWGFEVIGRVGTGGKTAYISLFNDTDETRINTTELTFTSTTSALASCDFADGDPNFDNGDEFEIRTRSSEEEIACNIAKANLYVNLTSLSKAQTLWTISRRIDARSTAANAYFQRILHNSSGYTTPTEYFESTGYCTDNGNRLFLRDHSTADSGTDGADVTNSGINFNSVTRARKRTVAVTPDDDDRFYARLADPTNNFQMSNAWLIVNSAGGQPNLPAIMATYRRRMSE